MQTIFYEIDQYQNQRIEVTINGKVVCHGESKPSRLKLVSNIEEKCELKLN